MKMEAFRSSESLETTSRPGVASQKDMDRELFRYQAATRIYQLTFPLVWSHITYGPRWHDVIILICTYCWLRLYVLVLSVPTILLKKKLKFNDFPSPFSHHITPQQVFPLKSPAVPTALSGSQQTPTVVATEKTRRGHFDQGIGSDRMKWLLVMW